MFKAIQSLQIGTDGLTGEMELNGRRFVIVTDGSSGFTIKPNAMFRTFDMRFEALQFTVKAQSTLTRCFDILSDGLVVGTIRPANPFTWRAFIECSASVPELVQLFSFWLAVVTWRRVANSSPPN